MASSSSSSTSPKSRFTSSQTLSLQKQLSLAIHDTSSCPICLSHTRKPTILSPCLHLYCIDCIQKWSQLKRTCPLCNSQFTSWFIKSRSSPSNFVKFRLPKFNPNNNNGLERRRRDDTRLERQRFLSDRDFVRNHTRELPVRRSFGFFGVTRCVLEWRASIYQQGLRAVALPSKKNNIQRLDRLVVRIKERIEPWIRRELQVLLQDVDSTVIVHLATELYILSFEERAKRERERECVDVDEERFVQQLRPFLMDRTDMFWHELRCYAESSFEMATYDSLVEYRQPSQ